MTCGWVPSDTIATNLAYVIPDPMGLQFAIIESRMFMTWQKTVGGYLGQAGCRFSGTVTWNNLPLPDPSKEDLLRLMMAGRRVLDARAHHPGQSLKSLYDPMVMPTDLREAHRTLDAIMDRLMGAPAWLKDDDGARRRLLFARYAGQAA